MTKKSPVVTVNSSPLSHGLPGGGRLIAFVVGLEDYQSKQKGQLAKVDYARNDAEQFAAVLKDIYGADRCDVQLLVDSDATVGTLGYLLKQTIASLEKDDLFIFYYAGHGYHGAGGNRITAWDSNAYAVEGTTLLLQEVLIAPLAESACTRALAFVDACGSPVPKTGIRDVLSTMDLEELNAFLASATYSGLFLSCEPGQKSYPAPAEQHGIWTYFLLAALRGEDDRALDANRNLTDASLRDFLRDMVPSYLTKKTDVRGSQRPMALLAATNTFLIRHVPEPTVVVGPEGDLAEVGMVVKQEYFERVVTGAVKQLPGWKAGSYYVANKVTAQTNAFVTNLLAPQIDEEIQDIYRQAKAVFGLRRSNTSQESEGGHGRLDTEVFRFSIESRQVASNPSEYAIARRLELRDCSEEQLQKLDTVFGSTFDRIVVKTERLGLDFDALVEFFEDVKDVHGGELDDDYPGQTVTYTLENGPKICIDVVKQKVVIKGTGRQPPSTLLREARKIRIGGTASSQRLLR